MKAYFRKKEVTFKGKVITLYAPRWMYDALGITRRTYLRWQKLGLFPKPVFDLEPPAKWYTATEVVEYAKKFSEMKFRLKIWKDKDIHQAFLEASVSARRTITEGNTLPLLPNERLVMVHSHARKVSKRLDKLHELRTRLEQESLKAP